jgi:hypothetical protein
MFTISKTQVDLNLDGQIPEFYTEASDIGLRAGEWPDFVAVLDEKNEGWLFMKEAPVIRNDELAAYRYSTKSGNMILTIIND